MGPQFLAWSGDHSLEYITSAMAPPNGPWTSSLLVLNTSAPTHSLAAASRVLVRRFVPPGRLGAMSPWSVTNFVISGDGRMAFAALLFEINGDTAATRQVVLRLSAKTGAALGILTPPAIGWSNLSLNWCYVLWTDSSGRHLLVSCQGGSDSGRVDNGVFTPIPTFQPAPYVPGLDNFAW